VELRQTTTTVAMVRRQRRTAVAGPMTEKLNRGETTEEGLYAVVLCVIEQFVPKVHIVYVLFRSSAYF